jgi:aspartyl/asparaginyl-tRNA synthetase
VQLFKGYLLSQGFQEIHTPKLIAGASGTTLSHSAIA